MVLRQVEDRGISKQLLSADDLRGGVARLAGELSATYDDGLVLVGVLTSAVPFLADLVRELTILPDVDFLAVSSYATGTGGVRLLKDLDIDISGRDVVVVEAAVDTGLTLGYLMGELERRRPRSLEVCTLIDKSARRLVPVRLRFVGFEVTEELLVGYGLAQHQRYRNLDLVAVADEAMLVADPDAHVGDLYRR